MSRTWLVTGTSSGFGLEMTRQLLARGDRVAATARRLETVEALRCDHGDRLWTAVLDVTDTTAIRDVVERAYAELGRIDVVVNNAGYALFGAAEELSDEQISDQVDTNLLGSIQVTRAALAHLRRQGGGRIIQISTYGGQAVNPGASLYNATKFGIEGFMESLAIELEPFGIGVTIVEPGSARTGFRGQSARLAEPLAAYDGTPAALTRGVRKLPQPPIGDPARMVKAMIATVDQTPAPRRLVLGSDAWRYIHDALAKRIEEVDAQRHTVATSDDPQAA